MAVFANPFILQNAVPGKGYVHISILPPGKPTYSALNCTYPLKLVPSSPHVLRHNSSPTRGLGNVIASRQTGKDGNEEEASAATAAAAASETADLRLEDLRPDSVPLLFLLSYGGGLLPPDTIDLTIKLDSWARLAIATQGSTKIFPSHFSNIAWKGNNPEEEAALLKANDQNNKYLKNSKELPLAKQRLEVHLAPHAALCLTPDPTQPFAKSRYEQLQIFHLYSSSSLLLLDWTNEGRRARQESWDAFLWTGCNELWLHQEHDLHTTTASPERRQNSSMNTQLPQPSVQPHVPRPGANKRPRLQIRDRVLLEASQFGNEGLRGVSGFGMHALSNDKVGCFGTVICAGPLLRDLGSFFVAEFEALPRIGGRSWDEDGDEKDSKEKSGMSTNGDSGDGGVDIAEQQKRATVVAKARWRMQRLELERREHVLWNAARVRGLVVVKFATRDAQGARLWLGDMLAFEGTVLREFGPGGLMSVK